MDLSRFDIEGQMPMIMAKVPETIAAIEQFVSNIELDKLLEIYRQKVTKQGL